MPSPDPDRRAAASREPANLPTAADNAAPTPGDLNTMWKLHRLEQPTFDDLTRGLCLGLVWCMAMWTPMFVSALT
ncbi:hypothetical protein [Azospirillum ramasamyi]|uniref:hypothetical protein n=1 Tax=Azospirillum ramasamyi TaxID=682998 RepID=UPI0013A6F323|nr:hypothetical protein [Azospirillum ramasamyi]